uniref:DHHA2 domain-containing protein n=1 Tax=Panagrellus redivivus TaxID=6233 RepID=A0A7E4ULQ6_PANRE
MVSIDVLPTSPNKNQPMVHVDCHHDFACIPSTLYVYADCSLVAPLLDYATTGALDSLEARSCDKYGGIDH